jgi:HEAT repeat protein
MKHDAAPAVEQVAKLLSDIRQTPRGPFEWTGSSRPIGELAAYSLWGIGESAEPALVAAINSGPTPARKNALVAAQGLHDPSIFTALVDSLHSGVEDEKHNAYLAIVQGYAKFSAPPLIALFQDVDPIVRMASITGLGRVGDKQGLEVVLRGLNDNDSRVRAVAEEAVARSSYWVEDDRLVEPLLSIVADSTHRDRRDAIRSLGAYPQARVVDDLIPLLKEQSINPEAAFALGKIGDPAAIKPLVEMMQNGGYSYRADSARQALCAIGGEATVEALFEIVKADGPGRAQAVRAIEQITHADYTMHRIWEEFKSTQASEGIGNQKPPE